MKKILQIVDSPDWAIGHLSKGIVDRLPKYEWKQIVVHPKDLEHGKVDLGPVAEAIKWADVVDFQYWRTASQLMDKLPELLKEKATVITHQNDKDLFSADWKDFKVIIARTNYAYKKLREVYGDKVQLITIGIDIDQFPWHGKDAPAPVVGYVGRIVPWKGLKEVARACYELGYELMVMGKMDKPSYWEEIPEEHRQNMDLSYFECSDEERLEAYKKMMIYVGNSGPGRESGTMPYMEAMAVGVPVVTTPSGIAQDIGEDEKNCLMVNFGDYDGLKEAIQRLMTDEKLRETLRQNAWDTVRNQNWDRMANLYSKAYNRAFFSGEKLVSVIIPSTFDRVMQVREILTSLSNQTYKNIEAIVCWDEEIADEIIKPLVMEQFNIPITYLITKASGYNLAMARNKGIVEADGEFLMFCDSRILPEPDAVQKFIEKMPDDEENLTWLFGEKGGGKRTFVENFSFIRRRQIIMAGMFNERITRYGAMSQEVRCRFNEQGFTFVYVPEAKASTMLTSRKDADRRKDIIKSKNLLWKIGM